MAMRNVMAIRRERRKVRKWTRKASRRAFEQGARRQCLVINAAAQDPNSDEAAVMRELEAHWIELSRLIEAEEARSECAI
jgi:hypothetical protein